MKGWGEQVGRRVEFSTTRTMSQGYILPCSQWEEKVNVYAVPRRFRKEKSIVDVWPSRVVVSKPGPSSLSSQVSQDHVGYARSRVFRVRRPVEQSNNRCSPVPMALPR